MSSRLPQSTAWRLALAVWVALLLGAFALITRTPALGVADNGDFWRVATPAGLAHSLPYGDVRQRYVDPRFMVGETAWQLGISSPACVAWLARVLDTTFASDPGSMAIQSLGIVYLVMLAGVLAALAGRDATLAWLGALLLWVVTDPGYLLFFNSFFAEPVLVIGLAAIALWCCRFGELRPLLLASGAERWVPLAALCGLLAFLGFSKLLYAPLPLGLLLVLLPQLTERVRLSPRAPLSFAAAALAIAVAAPVYFGSHGVQRFEHINAYNRVFVGVALVARDREATLSNLGIPRDRVKLVGTGYFKLSEAESAHPDGATVWRTLRAYVADPVAAGRAALRVARALASDTAVRLGQYTAEESAGRPRPYHARVWDFSTWRKRVLASSVTVGLLWLFGVGWVIVRLRRGIAPRLLAIAALLLMVPLQAAAVVLGDGFFALHRHLVGARLALDLVLVLLIFDVAAALITLLHTASARGSSSRLRWGSRRPHGSGSARSGLRSCSRPAARSRPIPRPAKPIPRPPARHGRASPATTCRGVDADRGRPHRCRA